MEPDLSFHLPMYLELGATMLWALTGSLVAARRGYDVAGLMVLAVISSAGGGLLRDGIFINQGPPLFLRSPVFISIAVGTALVVWAVGHRLDRVRHLERAILLLDAVGMGAFGLVGLQISLQAGLALPAAVFVGVVNAVGGEILRDVLTRREPTIFKPGIPSALAALAGCLTFLALVFPLGLPGDVAGPMAVATVFLIRAVALRYNVRTRPALGYAEQA